MVKKVRRNHSPDFKAKVALEAVRELYTVAEIAERHKIHPTQVNKWKKDLLSNLPRLFDPNDAASTAPQTDSEREEELLKKIGELTVERDFLARGLERIQ